MHSYNFKRTPLSGWAKAENANCRGLAAALSSLAGRKTRLAAGVALLAVMTVRGLDSLSDHAAAPIQGGEIAVGSEYGYKADWVQDIIDAIDEILNGGDNGDDDSKDGSGSDGGSTGGSTSP